MENNKVLVISTIDATIVVSLPEYHFRHVWRRKGEKFPVEKELLEQMMYDIGTEGLFKKGTLYIEDMEVKKEVGLEPYDAEEPVNIIVLDDNQKKKYLTVKPLYEFKEMVDKLSDEQVHALAMYAVANKIIDLDKSEYIKKRIGTDIIKCIQSAKEAEATDTKETKED